MDRCLYRVRTGIISAMCLWFAGCQISPQFRTALDNTPIQPGDILLVNSSASSDPFALEWPVTQDGNVHLPYGREWKVAGKTPAEVADELSEYFSVGRTVRFKIEKIGPAQKAGRPGASVQTNLPTTYPPKIGNAKL